MDRPVVHLNDKELRFNCSWCQRKNVYSAGTLLINTNGSADCTCAYCLKISYAPPPLTHEQWEKLSTTPKEQFLCD
ncbi:MAG: hypothetical protein COX77_04910 [Candidatus Komeilibacteria bacterium CG_4_10_14_0_2_um_filter_37_10]|uniref:Uncharacterized protein n=1 Tax=Candidatus Komeilibacteria bacterium CG_4_10_14_0_2_um_filter_37_10 TaxID=1974470 RepID=A0A2M7VD16_9BACT|nr:MAG: hypothetical protein COX77_04910 [Candidatus Komeilibacteria bacterium CG_4_10_14_0_2_um_filter_37_10]